MVSTYLTVYFASNCESCGHSVTNLAYSMTSRISNNYKMFLLSTCGSL